MPSVSDFLEAAGMIASFNAIIFFAGRAMLRSMKRKGFHLRAFHGWYVWVWMMSGVAVGGSFCPWTTASTVKGVPLGMGFLVGLLGGTIHGLLVLGRAPGPTSPDESEPKGSG